MEESPFKSVMLCERPNFVAPIEHGNVDLQQLGKNGSNQRPPPFYSLVAKREPLGFNRPCDVVPASELIMNIPKKKELVYLDRHRRYLKELDTMQRALKVEHETTIVKEEEKKKKSHEKWLNRRELRMSQTVTSPTGDAKRPLTPKDEHIASSPTPKSDGNQLRGSSSHASTSAKASKSRKNTTKPSWAMTQEEIEKVQEDEVDALLEFASNLDFDDYLVSLDRKSDDELRKIFDDLEQAEKIVDDDERIQKVSEIMGKQTEPSKENHDRKESSSRTRTPDVLTIPPSRHESRHEQRPESRDPRSELRSSQRMTPKVSGDVIQSHGGVHDAVATDANPVENKVADRILQSSHAMRTIHSSASLRAIIKEKMYRLQQRQSESNQSALKAIPEDLVLPPISAHRHA
eukprot:TRINITY_DN2319_c0_g1_i1.p1 TRINITY_DN2319_c0_g1~~TRINITY_DN2319_c0_g1_i1.p1  ORF type:complete len:404 (-),score=111.99 TRINITY_DN2319_c0_g1_i1:679-1890(-)